jgi:hypothetical protein
MLWLLVRVLLGRNYDLCVAVSVPVLCGVAVVSEKTIEVKTRRTAPFNFMFL